jgi:predicted lipoprotein with Yx(FWY)xxD motif
LTTQQEGLVTRTPILVLTGALGALALAGCAPNGGYGSGGPPDLVSATSPAPAPSPSPTPAPTESTPAPELTDTLIATTVPRMGAVVTDQHGWVLYRFDRDAVNPSKSNCEDRCAEIWPPALTDGNPTLKGVAPDKVGTVLRADGRRQLTIGKWPVYRYAGDLKPGQWKGQAVNGTWFVVTKDGTKNLTCLPKGTPTPVAPPARSANPSPTQGSSDY